MQNVGRGADPDAPLATLAICTRNRSAELDRCLASVAQVAGIGNVEVLVVDNGSTDDTPAIVDRWAAGWPMLRSAQEPVKGLSRARNTALQHARGNLVAFVDDDVLLDPGWFDGLIGAYRRWPHVAGVAGRIELAWPGGRPAWLPESREVWFAKLDLGAEPRLLADWERPVGANMSVRLEVAIAAGGFDPNLGYDGSRLLGNEELEFFDRVRRDGHQLAYEPSAHVVHVVDGRRVTRRYLIRRVFAQGRSDVRVTVAGEPHGIRDLLGLAGRGFSRALLRGWRHDVRRLASSRSRGVELVEVVTGRAKQLGIASEAVRLAGARGRRAG